MMYNNYQQQPQINLPANPTQIEQPFVCSNINNPPFVPNIPVAPVVQQFLATITGCIMMELQSYANRNPLRTFAFNVFAKNGYANNDFSMLVKYVADVTALACLKHNSALENIITDCVVNGVAQASAVLAAQYMQNGLSNFIDPSMHSDISNMAQQYQNMLREINAAQQPQQYQQQSFTNQTSNTGFNTFNPGRSPNAGRHQGQSFFNQGQEPQQTTPQTTSRFDRKIRNEEPVVQQQEWGDFDPSAFKSAATETISEPTNEVLNWEPCGEQPYRYAYDPKRFVKTLDKVNNKVVEVITVDEEAHRIPKPFGNSPKTKYAEPEVGFAGRFVKAVEDVFKPIPSDVSEEGEVVEPSEADVFKQSDFVFKDKWIVETSLTNAWFVLGMDRLMLAKVDGSVPNIYTSRVFLAEPVIGMRSFKEELKGLVEKSNSFISFKDELNKLQDVIPEELYWQCDRKITNAVNRAIQQSLSIVGIDIDSFINDVDGLDAYMREHFGDGVAEALAANEKFIIKKAFTQELPEEAETSLIDLMVDGRVNEKGEKPTITFVVSNYSMTLLNFLGSELMVQVDGKEPGVLTEEYTPTLYSLAVQLFQNMPDVGSFERHLLRTRDGWVMELTRGFFGTNSYLVTVLGNK